MKVRMIRAWRFYPVGFVIDPPSMLGNWLLQRKLAERVTGTMIVSEPKAPKPERASKRAKAAAT